MRYLRSVKFSQSVRLNGKEYTFLASQTNKVSMLFDGNILEISDPFTKERVELSVSNMAYWVLEGEDPWFSARIDTPSEPKKLKTEIKKIAA